MKYQFVVDKEARTGSFEGIDGTFDFDALIEEKIKGDESAIESYQLRLALAEMSALDAKEVKVEIKHLASAGLLAPINTWWDEMDQAGINSVADEAESVKIRNGKLTMVFKVDDIDFGEADPKDRTFSIKEGEWTVGGGGGTGERAEGSSTIPYPATFRLKDVDAEYEGTTIYSRGNGKTKLYIDSIDDEHLVSTLYKSMQIWGCKPQSADPKRPWGHAAKYLMDNHLEEVVEEQVA